MSIKKNIFFFLFLACLLTLIIFVARFYNSISIFEIRHVLTSGYEEESLQNLVQFKKKSTLFKSFRIFTVGHFTIGYFMIFIL